MTQDCFIRRKFNYSFNYSFVFIIIANFIIYFLTSIFPKTKLYLGLFPVLFIQKKMYWQLVTYMFIHGSIFHLLSNMLGLLFFGYAVERALGTKEFLLIYFLCGIASGSCSLLFYYFSGNLYSILIGASGALYAILFIFAVIFPKSSIYLWGLLPIPSPILIFIYAGIELFSQFSGKQDNIAHFAHLFGFLSAYVYTIIRFGVNPFKVWKNAFKN